MDGFFAPFDLGLAAIRNAPLTGTYLDNYVREAPIGKARRVGTDGGVVAEASGKSCIERTDNLRIPGDDDALPRMWSLWLQQKDQHR